MMVGETPGSEIEVQAFVEIADLLGLHTALVHLFDYGSATRRVVPSTSALGQFDNLEGVVCACEFIRSGQAANAGTEDNDGFACSRPLGKLRRTRPRFG